MEKERVFENNIEKSLKVETVRKSTSIKETRLFYVKVKLAWKH